MVGPATRRPSAFAAPTTADQVGRYLTGVLDRPVAVDPIVDGLRSTRALVPPSTGEPEPLVGASR